MSLVDMGYGIRPRDLADVASRYLKGPRVVVLMTSAENARVESLDAQWWKNVN